jgi:phosphonate transport system substrate-binding protein
MVCFLYLATLLGTACSDRQSHYEPTFEAAGKGKKVLSFGVPGQEFYETTDLLVQYLNDHLDSVTIQTVACVSVEDYQNKLQNNYFDFTVINGAQLVSAEHHGYRVVGRIADSGQTVIFVNKDSGIRQFSDLSGRTICLPGKNTLAGTMTPLLYLYRHGVDVNGNVHRLYAPSFESAMLDVYLGRASAGTAWKPAWDVYLRQRPEIAGKLEARWVTPPLINAGMLFRSTLPDNLVNKVAGLFFQLPRDEQGRRALQRLELSGFAPADSNSFRPMEAFLKEYNAVIH